MITAWEFNHLITEVKSVGLQALDQRSIYWVACSHLSEETGMPKISISSAKGGFDGDQ